MPTWALAISLVAALKVMLALVVYLSGLANPAGTSPIPLWIYPVLTFAFGATGATLIVANRSDPRAAWLGGILMLIAAQIAGPLVLPRTWAMSAWVTYARPDAFLPSFLWFFAACFPSVPPGALLRVTRGLGTVSLVVGAIATAVNLSIPTAAAPSALGWRALLSASSTPGSRYWTLVFALSLAALGVLFMRMVRTSGSDRRRTVIFGIGILGGFAPLFVEVLIGEALPAYRAFSNQPHVRPYLGLVLFAPLALVPIVTAYSVFYDHIVDMRIVMRAAMQYLLARYAIAATTLLPFAALALYLYIHRADQIDTLLSGRRPLILLATIALGIAQFRWRDALLHSIDQRFFRERYDASLLLSNFMRDTLRSATPETIAVRLAQEIDHALHAAADLYITGDGETELRDARSARRPLRLDAMLVQLASARPDPMDVADGQEPMLARLPVDERQWLHDGRYQLLTPLRGRLGEMLGLLAVGEKRSGLAFAAGDRRSIAALAAPVALALENDRLRVRSGPSSDEPGRECQRCGRIHGPQAGQCGCGGELKEGQVPHILRDVYRFDQRIGAGGMGVVYRATDLKLNRTVAIKTLPSVSPEDAAMLRQEGQAMAALTHSNLAAVHAVDSWRDRPFLVEEYLAGGTLADRLRGGRYSTSEALDLGITVSLVLSELHANGIVHCDIKPSNIGFSHHGIVKLIDFGLARLLRGSGSLLSTTVGMQPATPSVDSVVVSGFGILGTLPYMSPEATRGERPTPRVDLWSLSVVMFEVIGGQRPFSGRDYEETFASIRSGSRPPLITLRPDCPGAVSDFFDRALAPDPGLRPASAEELRHQLTHLRTSIG